MKFVQEKKLIQRYFDEISQDTGKYCFGVEDTLKGLDLGAIETLIVWENLDITRYVLRNAAGGIPIILQHPTFPNFNLSQRKLSFIATKNRRKIGRSSLTSQQALKWSKSRSHKVYLNGLPKSTRILAQVLRYVRQPSALFGSFLTHYPVCHE